MRATDLKEFGSPETTYVSRYLSLDYEGESVEIQNNDGVERGRNSLGQAMSESDWPSRTTRSTSSLPSTSG